MVSAEMQKKAKQIAFIAGVSLAAVFVLATLARRFPIVAQVQQKIAQGL